MYKQDKMYHINKISSENKTIYNIEDNIKWEKTIWKNKTLQMLTFVKEDNFHQIWKDGREIIIPTKFIYEFVENNPLTNNTPHNDQFSLYNNINLIILKPLIDETETDFENEYIFIFDPSEWIIN